MKQYLLLAVSILLFSLFTTIIIQQKVIKAKNEKIITLSNNNKALKAGITVWKDKYGKEHSKTIQYSSTTRELHQSNDSLDRLLVKVLKDNKIKDSKLNQAGIIISKLEASIKADSSNTFTTVDTNDSVCQTLTKDSLTKFDVCFNPVKRKLISVKPVIVNEQDILFLDEKVTINPRRKFFLFRLFQKKQIICSIEVINSNTNIQTLKSKFTKIIE